MFKFIEESLINILNISKLSFHVNVRNLIVRCIRERIHVEFEKFSYKLWHKAFRLKRFYFNRHLKKNLVDSYRCQNYKNTNIKNEEWFYYYLKFLYYLYYSYNNNNIFFLFDNYICIGSIKMHATAKQWILFPVKLHALKVLLKIQFNLICNLFLA